MKKVLQRAGWIGLFGLMVVGCSKPGDSTVEPEPINFVYSFVAEDARIVGLLVTDRAGASATEVSPGVYEFAQSYEPELPITFASQNTSETAVTFQDIDGNGEYGNADIRYNVGFEIAYIGNFDNAGQRQLFGNPLTALIPAEGIPSSGIAGVPEQVLQQALLAGVDNASEASVTLPDGTNISTRQLIKRSVALITSVQEAIVSVQGQSSNSINTAKQLLIELRNADLSTGLDDPTDFVVSAQDIIAILTQEDSAVVTQVAQQVGEILASEQGGNLSFFESLVLTVQQGVSPDSTSESVAANVSVNSAVATDNGVEFAINLVEEIEQAGGLAAFLNSLVLVPIDAGDNGKSLVDGQVSDFNLELLTDTTEVQLNATNAFFDDAVLEYFFADDLYGVKVDDNHAVLMTLNANETNLLGAASRGVNAARLLALCWNEIEQNEQSDDVCGVDNVNLEFYALATSEEVCQFGFDEVELAEINSLNRLQISCN